MLTLEELKAWLRIDFNDDDNELSSLLSISYATIEAATGITKDYVESHQSTTLSELYKMTQIILITDLYNNETSENKALTSFYLQLEAEYRKCKKNDEDKE